MKTTRQIANEQQQNPTKWDATPLPSLEEESEQCQWENCGGGRYCEKHSLESKGMSLPSVEKFTLGIDTNEGKYTADIGDILTHDRNQAYTRLVEGIDRNMRNSANGFLGTDMWDEGYNEALTDILEKVVKPLYNKTGDN